MSDIEDVVTGETPGYARPPRPYVISKRYLLVSSIELISVLRAKVESELPVGDNIPATEAVYIRTWGCSHNNSDSEYMAGLLAASGFRITGSSALR